MWSLRRGTTAALLLSRSYSYWLGVCPRYRLMPRMARTSSARTRDVIPKVPKISKRTKARERHRTQTIDLTEVAPKHHKLRVVRAAPEVQELLDMCDEGTRAERVARALETAEPLSVGVVREGLKEVFRLRRPDLAAEVMRSRPALIETLRDEPKAVTSLAAAACRSGEYALVFEIGRRLFSTEDVRGARPGRVYGPLVCGLLRAGNRESSLEAARAWARAEDAAEASDLVLEPKSTAPFNAALVEARKAKSLRTVFEVLDAMDRARTTADDDTFEVIANVAARSLDFVTGAISLETLPDHNLKEAVFVGRSNVGKSSLVNMLTNRKSAAYTSKTPGKTQQFNYFELNAGTKEAWDASGNFYLVDVPGLGYAKVPQGARQEWAELLENYLANRSHVAVAFHLIDSRTGVTAVDRDIFTMVDRASKRRRDQGLPDVNFVLVLTKVDKKDAKATEADVRAILADTLGDDGDSVAATTPVLITSAATRRGRDAMWRHLRHAALPSSSRQACN